MDTEVFPVFLYGPCNACRFCSDVSSFNSLGNFFLVSWTRRLPVLLILLFKDTAIDFIVRGYGLNVCVPTQIQARSANPSVAVFGVGALGAAPRF